jgi:hypothetical protein
VGAGDTFLMTRCFNTIFANQKCHPERVFCAKDLRRILISRSIELALRVEFWPESKTIGVTEEISSKVLRPTSGLRMTSLFLEKTEVDAHFDLKLGRGRATGFQRPKPTFVRAYFSAQDALSFPPALLLLVSWFGYVHLLAVFERV